MGRGSYNGGSTVLGPKSGWFSKSTPANKRKSTETITLRARERAEAKVEAKAKAKSLLEQKRLEEAARKSTPEYQAAQAALKLARRAKQRKRVANKQIAQEKLEHVEIYIRRAGRERLVQIGTNEKKRGREE